MLSIRTEVINVTPAIAANFLKKNVGNRARTKANITSYAEQMARGEWKFNGENIIISESGRLLNGQNRLYAVIESKTNVLMSFIFGIDDTTFDTMDTGQIRRTRTMLYIDGIKPQLTPILSTQIRLDINVKHLGVLTNNKKIKSHLTPAAILSELKQNDDYMIAAEFINSFPKKNRLISSGHLAFLAYRFFKINEEFSKNWLEGLILGINLEPNDYRLWIRNKLWRNMNSTRKIIAADKDLLIIKAWRWSMNNITIKHENNLKPDKSALKYIALPTDLC